MLWRRLVDVDLLGLGVELAEAAAARIDVEPEDCRSASRVRPWAVAAMPSLRSTLRYFTSPVLASTLPIGDDLVRDC